MLEDIKLMTLASALARHSAERHSVITENIANADTRGYKAKDLEPFEQAFARMSRMGADPGADKRRVEWRLVENAQLGAHSPNGNSVSIEDQMMRSIEAQGKHDAAATIYKKAMDILRTSLGRGF